VAARKKTVDRPPARNSKSAGAEEKNPVSIPKKYWTVLFWIAFAIFLYGLFLFNRKEILSSIAAVQKTVATHNAPAPLPQSVQETMISPPQTDELSPAPLQETIPASGDPANDHQELQFTPDDPAATAEPDMQTIVEMQDRSLYFTHVERGGNILRIKVNRKLPVSGSPMTDALHALLSGPIDDEKERGLISLIPEGTKLLSAAVRDGTAYVNFSEDFQYNVHGIDGYIGQLCEIVFTATEFSTVRDVQILIQGRRIEYLAESIWIGSPLSRDTL